ncbi:low-specificity L-threonine aldolase [Pleionea sediminis]|uniref:low-specificity L-threonine aldolase n=1 Tax=Pleionea sediminis TaxID=2569479 RepID=UPI0011866371|nr:low-specificity L-threonine aldolase [Pleionea sediminis]
MKKIDLRSDTVTLPSPDMKDAMMSAPLGDDVYGEDPTVNQLESYCAALLNKEAAIFAPSGTQSNLLGLMSHCERGDEYIVGQDAHTYKYEGGGAAVLGSIQPQPLEYQAPGIIPIEKIKAAIKPKDNHFARTRLVCLENTQAGVCVPSDYTSQIADLCKTEGLAFHLDGARLFNAVVATGESIESMTHTFDSVSLCLSKGLGAPAGSVLVGSKTLIEKARRWRKVLGGAMRQSGMLAGAGLYALQNNIERLADDHRRAKSLADALRKIGALTVSEHSGVTNMVFVNVPTEKVAQLQLSAQEKNIVLPEGESLRLVTHLDIDDNAIEKVINVFTKTFN